MPSVPAAAPGTDNAGDISTVVSGTEAFDAAALDVADSDGAVAAAVPRAVDSNRSDAPTSSYAVVIIAAASIRISGDPPSIARDDIASAACVRAAVTHCARSIAATAQSTASPLIMRSEPARVAVARAATDVVAFGGAVIDWTAFDTTHTAYSPYYVAAVAVPAAVVVVCVNLAVLRQPHRC